MTAEVLVGPVPYADHGVTHTGEGRCIAAAQSIPERRTVVGRTAVAEGAGDHQDVARSGEIRQRHVVHVDQLRALDPLGHPASKLFSVASLGCPQHKRATAAGDGRRLRRTVDGL